MDLDLLEMEEACDAVDLAADGFDFRRTAGFVIPCVDFLEDTDRVEDLDFFAVDFFEDTDMVEWEDFGRSAVPLVPF